MTIAKFQRKRNFSELCRHFFKPCLFGTRILYAFYIGTFLVISQEILNQIQPGMDHSKGKKKNHLTSRLIVTFDPIKYLKTPHFSNGLNQVSYGSKIVCLKPYIISKRVSTSIMYIFESFMKTGFYTL